MSAEGGGGSQSAMTQCWDLHGDDRTRVPHLHVESGPSAETADDTRPDIPAAPVVAAEPSGQVAGFRERFEAAMMNPGPLRVLPSGGWRERAEAAEAKLGELENAITWDTSCTSCARILDSAVAERERAERAEARLAVQREYDTYRRALWVMVRHFRGSVFLTSAQMEDVPLLASLGVGKEPGGIRINAGEEP